MDYLPEIKAKLDNASYREKGGIIRYYAGVTGKSEKTLYRMLKKQYGSPRKPRKRTTQVPDSYIDVIAKIKEISMGYGQKERELSTELAIKQAVDEGLVPPGVLTPSTVNRRIAENGFRKKKPVSRFVAEFCNQVHFFDMSRSEYISPVAYDEQADDWILKTHPKSLRYKNKEGRGMSLWLAGLRDDRSGIVYFRYYMTTGENVAVGLDFFNRAWNRPADEHPLNNPPYYLHIDNGAIGSSKEFSEAMQAIDVKKVHNKPYNKQAMGKIERMWRTLWQRFELPLISKYGPGHELRLEELNALVFDYTLEDMEREAPFSRLSKRVMFERDLMAHPPRRFDVDLSFLASWPERRKVRNDLTFSYRGEIYSAPERYYGKYIIVRENRQGDIIGRGEDDGILFEITPFRPQSYGDYRGYKDTYRDKLQKEIAAGVMRMKPREEKITVKSDFTAPVAETVMSDSEARLYIARQLNLESYAEVAELFDPLLMERRDKESIDRVINVVKSRAV